MSVNKMKRLSLAALRSDRDRLLRELVWLSSVEVSELDAASAFGSSLFLPAEHDGGDGRAALEEKLRIVREAAEAVGKYRKKNKNANRYGAATVSPCSLPRNKVTRETQETPVTLSG